MSLTCEISGEPIPTSGEEIVATPSGHVCIKRLLLQKLAENGGKDPFETIRDRPLSEDQLVVLHNNSRKMAPPRPQATALPNILKSIQAEYDALVLELFDTRKALEETRRELSQALYQNDAAVRVVARLAVERDGARQELERWQASVGASNTMSNDSGTSTNKTSDEPQTKRRKIEPAMYQNNLPEEDLNDMVEAWKMLHPQRKPMLKAAAASAPSKEDLGGYAQVDKKAWHKSTCKIIPCMAASEDLIVTSGSDKQLVVYNALDNVVKHTFALGSTASCVDVFDSLVAAGDADGRLVVFSMETGAKAGELKLDNTSVVHIGLHPSKKHVVAATSQGQVVVCLLADGQLSRVAQFEAEGETNYSSGALHPDGLLFAAGTASGVVHMWDFKNKTLASTLQEGPPDDAVVCIAFSANGYHLATVHKSAIVRFWDLRKQKCIATMNNDQAAIGSASCVAFDPSGKYAAYAGSTGVTFTTVKEWQATASIPAEESVAGIVWGKSAVSSCSDNSRDVRFYALKETS